MIDDDDIYSSVMVYVDVNTQPLIPTLRLTLTDATDQIYDQLWLKTITLKDEKRRDQLVELLLTIYRSGMIQTNSWGETDPIKIKQAVSSALAYVRRIINRAEEGLNTSLIEDPPETQGFVYTPPDPEEF